MAQSQAIFDCCRGNPLLLSPLPEGDNSFALLPSCSCSWEDRLALCHFILPRQREMPLCGIRLDLSPNRDVLFVSEHIHLNFAVFTRSAALSSREEPQTEISEVAMSLLFIIPTEKKLAGYCKGQISLKGSSANTNVSLCVAHKKKWNGKKSISYQNGLLGVSTLTSSVRYWIFYSSNVSLTLF